MALNTDIILQGRPAAIEAPDAMGQYGKALQLKQLMTQGQLQDQQLADDQSAREAFAASGGDRNKYLQALATGGNVKAYQTAQKNYLDTDKTQADIGKAQAETQYKQSEIQNQAIARDRDMLANVNTPQDAALWVQAGYQDPIVGKIKSSMMPLEQALSRIPTDPVLFQQWKQQNALGATKYIEQNKPTYQTRNLGGTTDTIALPGLGGPAQVVSSMRNTVSPDASLSAATQRRGQDLVDARTRQAQEQGKLHYDAASGQVINLSTGKAVPVTDATGAPIQAPNKALTDGQSKAALFGSRMDNSGRIIDELAAQGINKSMPGSQLGYGIGATVRALSPGDYQKLDQAKRDFINAALRRESGAVISPEEFANGEIQYFPQPGDSPAVIKQKAENRAIATRGILAEVPENQRPGLIQGITGRPQASALPTQGQQAPQSGQTFDSLPDPSALTGKRIQAPDGSILRSNGTKWIQEK